MSIAVTALPKAGLALARSGVPFLTEIVLRNTRLAALTDLLVELSAEPAIVRAQRWTVPLLGTAGPIALPAEIHLDGAALAEASGPSPCQLRVRVCGADGVEIAAATIAVELLGPADWAGAAVVPESLAAFVEPGDPAVARLALAGADPGPPPQAGYAGEGSALGLAEALWREFGRHKIDFALAPAGFERNGQRVRRPSDVLEQQIGTSLDLALMFAACLEHAGLNPIVVLRRGQAIVGLWTEPHYWLDPVIAEPERLRRKLRTGELVLVETTLLAGGQAQFRTACERGAALLAPSEDMLFELAVDVRAARAQGISPLLHPAASGSAATPEARLDAWARRAGPASRSPLLDLREADAWLALDCLALDALEGQLAAGAALGLSPRAPAAFALEPGGAFRPRPPERAEAANRHALAALDKATIHTDLEPEPLRGRLAELDLAARAALEATGAEPLFLVLGLLKTAKGDSKGEAFAPVLLHPVRLARDARRGTASITLAGAPARLNPLLREALQRAGIEPDPAEFAVALGARPPESWRGAQTLLESFGVREGVPAALLAVLPAPQEDLRQAAPAIAQRFRGHRLAALLEPAGTIVPPVQIAGPAEPVLPFPADPAQRLAIATLLSGQDCAITGPRGTGKTEALANAAAALAAAGQRVLVLARSASALDELRARLLAVGLPHLAHRAYAGPEPGADAEPTALPAPPSDLDAAWAAARTEIERASARIDGLAAALHRTHGNGLSPHSALAAMAAEQAAATPVDLDRTVAGPPGTEDVPRWRALCETLAATFAAIRAKGETAVDAIGRRDWSPAWQVDFILAAEALERAADDLEGQAGRFAADLGIGTAALSREALVGLIALGAFAAQPSAPALAAAIGPEGRDLRGAVTEAAALLRERHNRRGALADRFDLDAAAAVDVPDLKARWQAAARTWWPRRHLQVRRLRRELAPIARGTVLDDPTPDLDELLALADLERRLVEAGARLEPLGALWNGAATAPEAFDALLKWLDNVERATAVTGPETVGAEALSDRLRQVLGAAEASALRETAGAMLVAWNEFRRRLQDLAGIGELTADALGLVPGLGWTAGVKHQVGHWRAAAGALPAWCGWQATKAEAERLGLGAFASALERAAFPPGEIGPVFDANFRRWWLQGVVDSEPRLSGFQPDAEEADLEALGAAEAHQRELAPAVIRARIGQPAQPRCVLATPWSLETAAPAGAEVGFDVLLVEDADQLSVEAALGALGRSARLGVFGDPQGLRPSAFSETGVGLGDGGPALSPHPSLLDACLASDMPRHVLGTAHERRAEEIALLAAGPGAVLSTLPDPRVGARPLALVHVRAGAFDRTQRFNRGEAHAVVTAVLARLRAGEDDAAGSIAVLTVTAEQRNLVLGLLQDAWRGEAALERRAMAGPEPVLVRTVEEALPHTRDTVLLSLGIAPDQAGRLPIALPWLTAPGGERWLSAAAGTARRELVLFASLSADQIDLGRRPTPGLRRLKQVLELAQAASAPAPAGPLQPSPFADQVAAALRERGWTIERSLGRSATRLACAVLDPDEPSRFIAAILCEESEGLPVTDPRFGDAERLRGLGWRVLRASPLAWWRDPKAAAERLHAALEAVLQAERHDAGGFPAAAAPAPEILAGTLEADLAAALAGAGETLPTIHLPDRTP